MHIVLAILGIIAGAGYWWFYAKNLGTAANEAVDAVGRVRGQMRRKKISKRSAMSPITAIKDPVTAAATLITAIASEDGLVTPAVESRIRTEVGKIAEPEKLDEAVIYAAWAAKQVDNVQSVIDGCSALLINWLDQHEKLELMEMVNAVAANDERHPNFKRNMDRLATRLGLNP